ncbi:MAG: transcription termination/antitermination protein NusA [Deltaproteobacteria bacterium]|nr:transcription termination/antitermination protein NusA [Deltaproteobacteria bacterium]
MFESDIKRVVEQVSRDKGIDRQVLIKTMEEALKSAARKKLGVNVDIEVQYNEELGEIEVFQFKDVVKEVTEPDLEMSLEEGRKLDPGCEEGDSLGMKMDTRTFGRIAAQSAKQVIIQKMKDAERDVVYESFVDRKGEIINGIVQRMNRGDMIVNLGRTEAIVPSQEQVPRESYRRGERIRAFVLDVLHEARGPQIILSRTHRGFLLSLFKTEVPEISEGIVEIRAAAREPGGRSKIAVSSNASDVDPVGACVGMKGSRVQSVVQELKGEKIDIIPWHIDPARFVCNALAPAEVSRVVIDEVSRAMEVIVPDEHLSIAIGRRGQNVRLACKLTGWNIDVKSESQYSHAMRAGYESLLELPGMGVVTADVLYERGFYSIEELANATVEELTQIKGIGETKAQSLIEGVQQMLVAKQSDAKLKEDESGLSEGQVDDRKNAEQSEISNNITASSEDA